MRKPLVGHHLMRVRIRKTIFEEMQELAEEESERSGEHVTVSDIASPHHWTWKRSCGSSKARCSATTRNQNYFAPRNGG